MEDKTDLSGYVFALVMLLVLLSADHGWALAQIEYTPPSFRVCSASAFCAPSGITSLRISNGANAEFGEIAWESNFLFLRTVVNGGTGRSIVISSIAGPLYLRVGDEGWTMLGTSFTLTPEADDKAPLGTSTTLLQSAYIRRAIQGSKSKVIVDNTATAFVRIAVADDDYEGGCMTWTAYAEDTATDARQTRTGHMCFAINNNSGTEAVVFSTGDSAVQVTVGTLACTFDGTSSAADTIDLRATCDTSLAATTTLTFEYRLDLPSVATITPQ